MTLRDPAPRKHWLDFVGVVLVAAGFGASAWSAVNGTHQLKLAQETSERQLRAYVMPKAIEIDHFGTSQAVTARVEINNSGQTPAYKVKSWMRFALGSEAFSDFDTKPDQPLTNVFLASQGVLEFGPIGLRQIGSTTDHIMSEEEVKSIRRGTTILYVFGEIIYEDAFHKVRSTIYRSRIAPDPVPNGVNEAVSTQPLSGASAN